MNKRVKIFQFKEREQYRIQFVKLLATCSTEVGLKKAKELQDKMLEGEPFDYNVDEGKTKYFIEELDRLKLVYEILN